ncbi:hypothetical protein LAZ67_5002558 [Cordylochernes scorpioides]|uniref:CCHC-type domain-containing protein n=1 Tax=Cordylochernes scorpioides TaxID=51811 RepID=A0ABY6KH75_9ARAC|nr:hypothetical protein LAZ67_5002558 [Cordylochernes scorpioides]
MVPGSRAHRLLGTFTHTGENYENAIRALKSSCAQCSSTKHNFGCLHDEISAYIQSLESLNIPSEYLEVFLFPLVESCLPTEILQLLQRTPKAGYGRDDDQDVEQGKGDRLEALMSFLRAEKYPKPTFPSRQLHNNKNKGQHSYVSKNEKSKGSFLSTNYERKTKCIFCDKMGHENWKCFKVEGMTRNEQLKIMSDAGVCFKCLKRNHLRRHCRANFICQNCGEPHYLIFYRGNNPRRDSISEDGESSKERKKQFFSTKPKVLRSAHTILFIRNTF